MEGKFQFPDGSKYSGGYITDENGIFKRHGRGTQELTAEKFTGSYENDMMVEGRYCFSSGSIYEGLFDGPSSLPHGEGRYIFTDGATYSGVSTRLFSHCLHSATLFAQCPRGRPSSASPNHTKCRPYPPLFFSPRTHCLSCPPFFSSRLPLLDPWQHPHFPHIFNAYSPFFREQCWVKGKWHGQGVYTDKDGIEYRGNFVNGFFDAGLSYIAVR